MKIRTYLRRSCISLSYTSHGVLLSINPYIFFNSFSVLIPWACYLGHCLFSRSSFQFHHIAFIRSESGILYSGILGNCDFTIYISRSSSEIVWILKSLSLRGNVKKSCSLSGHLSNCPPP